MNKIRVFKTYNAADIVAIGPQLIGTLQSFPDFATGNTSIEINNDGTWYAMADLSLVSSFPKIGVIKNERDAFLAAQKWMKKFDGKLSSRIFANQLPKQLFDSNIFPVSAVPEIKEIYGRQIPIFWHCTYRILVKPSATEKEIVVGNAEFRLSLRVNGNVVSIEYDFLPINQTEDTERLSINGILPSETSIGYEFIKKMSLIVPFYYTLYTKNDE